MVGEIGAGLTIDGVNIVETNYTAFNGVVHIIDYGMAPSTSPEATVYQIVVDSPDHTLFEQEINANLLNDDLIGQPVINNNEYAPALHGLCPHRSTPSSPLPRRMDSTTWTTSSTPHIGTRSSAAHCGESL